ncbi:hypothetical protein GWC95_13195 [Sediminibacterium roseum]|uniref:Lipoprotein n=1 Tax=Sediminibacterium roseum TaxID=1978412 RepID=A0ABX0A0E2_9BACT|nr:hypothetical protein [Sediminibacterium roseum]NCI50888.1 hypothetical protein [Sediminibacterium roseum]
MKKWTLILCIFCLCKCAMDYSVVSNIKNSSGVAVRVEIQFGRYFFDSVFRADREKIRLSIQHINEQAGVPYMFDSSGLITKYLLEADKILQVDNTKGGAGVVPNHETIERITITTKGNVHVYEQKDLDTLFKKKDNATWELLIR